MLHVLVMLKRAPPTDLVLACVMMVACPALCCGNTMLTPDWLRQGNPPAPSPSLPPPPFPSSLSSFPSSCSSFSIFSFSSFSTSSSSLTSSHSRLLLSPPCVSTPHRSPTPPLLLSALAAAVLVISQHGRYHLRHLFSPSTAASPPSLCLQYVYLLSVRQFCREQIRPAKLSPTLSLFLAEGKPCMCVYVCLRLRVWEMESSLKNG